MYYGQAAIFEQVSPHTNHIPSKNHISPFFIYNIYHNNFFHIKHCMNTEKKKKHKIGTDIYKINNSFCVFASWLPRYNLIKKIT